MGKKIKNTKTSERPEKTVGDGFKYRRPILGNKLNRLKAIKIDGQQDEDEDGESHFAWIDKQWFNNRILQRD